MVNEKWNKALAEARAKRAKEAAPTEVEHDSDLIPEPVYEHDPQKVELDRVIDNIDIIDAYNRWCGKSVPQQRNGQIESIMISCPNPSHPDKHPSAWINTDKQVWHCAACEDGGDKQDLAAIHFGYSRPGYKTDKQKYPLLLQEMAQDYGYRFVETATNDFPVMIPPESVDTSTPLEQDVETNRTLPDKSDDKSDKTEVDLEALGVGPEEGTVLTLVIPDDDDDTLLPSLDWRSILTPNTFLSEYMTETTRDDVPEEFHFWNSLIALGCALGRDVYLIDSPKVYSNLFVCSLGHSGSGKSKARYHLTTVLSKALPYDPADDFSKGTLRVSSPGSAEALINSFSKPLIDPIGGKVIIDYLPVRGLVEYNELSSLVGRAARVGNVTKPTLMELYDMVDEVSTVSMATGLKKAKNPFASALTTTQPRAIATLLSQMDADSGFLNRWVFAVGPYKDQLLFNKIALDLRKPIFKLQEVFGWAGSVATGVNVSPEAGEILEKFSRHTIFPDQREDDSNMLVRMDLLVKKLCLLFAANEMRTTIEPSDTEKVIAMYSYLKACYKILAGKLGSSLHNDIRDEILKHLTKLDAKNPAGTTYAVLANKMRYKNWPDPEVLKALTVMGKLGQIQSETFVYRGQSKVRYRCAN